MLGWKFLNVVFYFLNNWRFIKFLKRKLVVILKFEIIFIENHFIFARCLSLRQNSSVFKPDRTIAIFKMRRTHFHRIARKNKINFDKNELNSCLHGLFRTTSSRLILNEYSDTFVTVFALNSSVRPSIHACVRPCVRVRPELI